MFWLIKYLLGYKEEKKEDAPADNVEVVATKEEETRKEEKETRKEEEAASTIQNEVVERNVETLDATQSESKEDVSSKEEDLRTRKKKNKRRNH